MRTLPRVLLVTVLLAFWSVVQAAYAAAADPSASSSSSPAATTNNSVLSGDAMAIITVVLIAASVISVGMVLWFTRDLVGRYYATASRLARGGLNPEPQEVQAGGPMQIGGTETAASTPVYSIKGATAGVVGHASNYEARMDGKPVDATWSLDPTDAGAVNPRQGSSTKLTPAKTGITKVIATAGGQSPSLEVAVVEPKGSTTKLPFVGRGWGGIAAGIVAVFTLFGLGLAGRLSSDALATLFGALLGVGAAAGAAAATGGKSGDDDAK
jgi:hypothetical protein